MMCYIVGALNCSCLSVNCSNLIGFAWVEIWSEFDWRFFLLGVHPRLTEWKIFDLHRYWFRISWFFRRLIRLMNHVIFECPLYKNDDFCSIFQLSKSNKKFLRNQSLCRCLALRLSNKSGSFTVEFFQNFHCKTLRSEKYLSDSFKKPFLHLTFCYFLISIIKLDTIIQFQSKIQNILWLFTQNMIVIFLFICL